MRSDGCLEGGQRLIDYRLPAAAQQGLLCTLHLALLCLLCTLHCRAGPTMHLASYSKAYYAPCTAEQGPAFTETRQVGSRTIFTEVLCTQPQQATLLFSENICTNSTGHTARAFNAGHIHSELKYGSGNCKHA